MEKKLIKQLESAINQNTYLIMFIEKILITIESIPRDLEKEDSYIHREKVCKEYLHDLISKLESDISASNNKISCIYKMLHDLHTIENEKKNNVIHRRNDSAH